MQRDGLSAGFSAWTAAVQGGRLPSVHGGQRCSADETSGVSSGEWLPRGWTCEHRGSKSFGPCQHCLPNSGLCEACGNPLDDHNGIGTLEFRCGDKKRKQRA